jgi:phage-related protein
LLPSQPLGKLETSCELLKDGPAFSIWALKPERSPSSVRSFLEELATSNPRAHAKIERTFERTTQIGPPILNKAICRKLHGGHADDIYEFKEIQSGVRILWFYSPSERKVIICTHIFIKDGEDTPRSEIDRAQTLRKSYE